MSVTRINDFRAKPGCEEALADFLMGVSETVRGLDGCESVQVLRDVEDDAHVAIVEVWRSIDAHKDAASAIPREEIAKVMPLLAVPPSGAYFSAP